VCPENGRYLAALDGRAELLAGSHTGATVQDISDAGSQAWFDFEAILAMCEAHGHNFIRLWHWEQPRGATKCLWSRRFRAIRCASWIVRSEAGPRRA
jgi:hypothetical protein